MRSLFAVVLCALALCSPAVAQEDTQEQIRLEMQRSSTQRDRQSEAFALQLEQRQREMLAPPGTLPALQALHAEQRRQFDNLSERQDSDERMSSRSGPSWGPRLDSGPQQERERRAMLERARREYQARSPR